MQAIGARYAQDYIARFGFDPKLHPRTCRRRWGGVRHAAADGGRVQRVRQRRLPHRPYLIARVVDARGNVISEAQPVVAGENAERVIDPRNAWIMTSLLKDVVAYGTATRPSRGPHRSPGKTGTPRHGRRLVLRLQRRPGRRRLDRLRPAQDLGNNETGSAAALPIWISYMART